MFRWLLLILLLLPGLASARTEVPDTPAGRAFSAWLLAFNQADRAGLEAFERSYGELQPVAATLEFREITGGYTLLAIERSEPRRLVVLVVERGGDRSRTRLDLRLDAGDPPTLIVLDIEPLPAEARDDPHGPAPQP